jgi:hypothetical protein
VGEALRRAAARVLWAAAGALTATGAAEEEVDDLADRVRDVVEAGRTAAAVVEGEDEADVVQDMVEVRASRETLCPAVTPAQTAEGAEDGLGRRIPIVPPFATWPVAPPPILPSTDVDE